MEDEFWMKGSTRKHVYYPGRKVEDKTEKNDDLSHQFHQISGVTNWLLSNHEMPSIQKWRRLIICKKLKKKKTFQQYSLPPKGALNVFRTPCAPLEIHTLES